MGTCLMYETKDPCNKMAPCVLNELLDKPPERRGRATRFQGLVSQSMGLSSIVTAHDRLAILSIRLRGKLHNLTQF
jgi:hypothetical protein